MKSFWRTLPPLTRWAAITATLLLLIVTDAWRWLYLYAYFLLTVLAFGVFWLIVIALIGGAVLYLLSRRLRR